MNDETTLYADQLSVALEVTITNRMDKLITRMEADLYQLGTIAMFGDHEQSNSAIEKAMRIKLALVWMRQGAPQGMTINAKIHQW